MADLTGGQLVARTLRQASRRAPHLFTLCGGHILPIYDGCLTEGVAVIDCRHEQAAAHAGDAYARLTRGLGVAVVVRGARRHRHAVTGVANDARAKLTSWPRPIRRRSRTTAGRARSRARWTRDTIVVGDGGDVVNCAREVSCRPGPRRAVARPRPARLSTASARHSRWLAKLLRPDQRVLLVSGDGAFRLNGMELETAVRCKLPFTCIIGNDGGWGQIRARRCRSSANRGPSPRRCRRPATTA